MRTIYKYNLAAGINGIFLPEGYKVLNVADQYGYITMWVEQDNAKPGSSRQFSVYGTGFGIYNDNEVYVGTAIMTSGLVWHVYENL
jgi:hypothetical protein